MDDEEVAAVAADLWAAARRDEQSSRRIPADQDAEAVRDRVRALAAADRVRVRTGRIEDAVVVVRLDAAVWHERAEVMRQKLRHAD